MLREKRDDLKILESRHSDAEPSPAAPKPARMLPNLGGASLERKKLARNRAPRKQIDYEIETYGPVSETKPKLFVAMPFSKSHQDEYDIAFVEAAHANDCICERLDLEHFTGDVVSEIERRIRDSKGMIALLNDLNPNVFLEIGYAMALRKPIIFVAREGATIPFDIRNHRRIEYTRIHELRGIMSEEIKALANKGVL